MFNIGYVGSCSSLEKIDTLPVLDENGESYGKGSPGVPRTWLLHRTRTSWSLFLPGFISHRGRKKDTPDQESKHQREAS